MGRLFNIDSEVPVRAQSGGRLTFGPKPDGIAGHKKYLRQKKERQKFDLPFGGGRIDRKEFLDNFHSFDKSTRKNLIKKNKDVTSSGVYSPETKNRSSELLRILTEGGETRGSNWDFIEHHNGKFFDGIGREIVRGAALIMPGDQKKKAEKVIDKLGFGEKEAVFDMERLGAQQGSIQKGAFDIASLLAPVAGVEKAAKGTKFIKALSEGSKKKKVAAKLLTLGAGEAIAAPIDAIQSAGRNQDFDAAESIAIGAGAGVATDIVLPKGGRILKKLLKNTPSSTGKGGGVIRSAIKKTKHKEKASKGGFAGRVQNEATKFYKSFKKTAIDDLAPIEDAVSEGVRKGLLNKADLNQVSVNLNKVRRASNIATDFVKNSTLPKAVAGFGDKEIEEFDEFLKAKHALTLAKKGVETGRSVATDKAIVKEAEGVFGWGGRQKQVVQFSRDLLTKSVNSGLTSKEAAEKLIKEYPDYVPFDRVMNEDGLFKMGGGDASISTQSVVRNLKGSKREIQPPTQTLLTRAGAIQSQILRNDAARSVIDALEATGVAKKVSSVDSKHSISLFRNGQKEIWEVPKDIESAAKSLDQAQLGILTKIASNASTAFKVGTTGLNPAFILPNMVKDQLGSFILSEHSLYTHNPINFVGTLMSMVKKDKMYQEALKSGAIASFNDTTRNVSSGTVKDLAIKGAPLSSKIYRTISNPKQFAKALKGGAEGMASASENFTRLQNYKGVKKATGDINKATLAAQRNSIDFFRGGSNAKALNIMLPYFNASIQGSAQLTRQLKKRPVETGVKIISTLLLPSAAFTLHNLNDPERKKIYEAIPEYQKENNFVYVQDSNNVFLIPKPSGVGGLARASDQLIEGMFGLETEGLKTLAANLISGFTPINPSNPANSVTPQVFKPALEVSMNKDLYTKKDIEREWTKIDGKRIHRSEIPKSERRGYDTPESINLLAKILDTSPVKAEKLVKGYTGDLGVQILANIDSIQGKKTSKNSLSRIKGRFNINKESLEYLLNQKN